MGKTTTQELAQRKTVTQNKDDPDRCKNEAFHFKGNDLAHNKKQWVVSPEKKYHQND